MKKKLESDLISIAHRILKLKGKEDVVKMHAEVSVLYEKLSVLKFAHDNFEDDIPTIGSDSSFFGMLDEAFNNKISDTIEVENKIYINLDEVEEDDIMEPVMEKIKDMVAQMPHETQQVDTIFEEATKRPIKKHSLEDLTKDFKNMPVFEPVSAAFPLCVKTGKFNIGLNDKIAFIKHLFDGNTEDYDRVVSQLNTSLSFGDAKRFIEDIVKPDYNDWKDREEFEERFFQIVESKFE